VHIYKTTNKISGKIYIGKSQVKNNNYLGSGLYLKRALKKYGKENFIREIIEDNIKDPIILCEKEIYWIEKLNSRNPKTGYNISKGGDGHSAKHSKETKNSLSIKKKEFFKNKENHPMFGKHHKNETIEILKKKCSGRKHTDSEISKMKIAQKGRKHSEETKEKIGKAHKGKKLTKQHKENIKKNHADLSAKNNPMYGKSIYSTWLEKFGKDVANEKYQSWIKKIGIKSKKNWEKKKYGK